LPKSSFSPGIPSFILEIPVARTTALAVTTSPPSRVRVKRDPPVAAMTFSSLKTAPDSSAWALPVASMSDPTTLPVPM